MSRTRARFARHFGTWRPRTARTVTFLLCLALTSAASLARACPDCAVGRAARSRLWHDDFWLYLTFSVLPFALIGALCIGIEVMGRRS